MKKAYNDLEIDEIDEISGVDKAAQQPARAVIFKRQPIADSPGGAVGSDAQGETLEKNKEPENMSDQKEPDLKAELAKVSKTITDLQAQLAVSNAEAQFNDAQREVYKGLDEAGKDAFRKLAPEQRAEKCRQAGSQDEVVYTSIDGRKFTKRHDPIMVEMAKENDSIRRDLLIEKTARQGEVFAKRAAAELSHMTGSESAKVELLKAVDSIPASGARDEVKAFLKAADSALSKAFETQGSVEGSATGDGPVAAEAKLEKLAKSLAEKKSITVAKAWDEVLQTDEGRELYKETLA